MDGDERTAPQEGALTQGERTEVVGYMSEEGLRLLAAGVPATIYPGNVGDHARVALHRYFMASFAGMPIRTNPEMPRAVVALEQDGRVVAAVTFKSEPCANCGHPPHGPVCGARLCECSLDAYRKPDEAKVGGYCPDCGEWRNDTRGKHVVCPKPKTRPAGW